MQSYSDRGLLTWTIRGDEHSGDVVLLLHGMDCGPHTINRLAESVERVWHENKYSTCHILMPQLPLQWSQCVDLKRLAEEMMLYLNENLAVKSIHSLTVVGHSAGGVVAQAFYMFTRKCDGTLAALSPRDIRLILIAPLNQGWEISHHLPLSKKISWLIGIKLITFVTLKEQLRALIFRDRLNPPWIMQLQRGSPFLVWIRLQWLELQDDLPQVVQLLGSIDEIVSWRDMIDMASGASFQYLDVPNSDHVTILDFDNAHYGATRREKFELALTLASGDKKKTVRPWDVDPAPQEEQVKRVIFVIHGIRDEGHWTQKIGMNARKIFEKEQGGHGDEIAIMTSSYGYFSMLEFLQPGKRLEKIHWLADNYVEAKRRYPNAKFSYIAHSNGTYLLAHALGRYDDMQFERVAFAGSVVSFRFNWDKLVARFREQQRRREVNVKTEMRVLNFTATSDWVVGLIPMIADVLPLKWLFGSDLGGAGVVPFRSVCVEGNDSKIGSHSAAIQEENWDHLARFAVAGVVPSDSPKNDPTYQDQREWWLREPAVFFVCPAAILLLLYIVVCYLPMLAWSNPVLFWGVPAILLTFCAAAIAWWESSLAHMTIHRRLEKGKRTGFIVTATVIVLLLWLIVGVNLLKYFGYWHDPIGLEWLKTMSVVFYVIGVYQILTKV
ncbi:MAG: alpha/beta hydrolase [Nitrospirales bacterium]|nr:alpha/beta hydrolase [Nitrospirales bacterium]